MLLTQISKTAKGEPESCNDCPPKPHAQQQINIPKVHYEVLLEQTYRLIQDSNQ